MRRATYIAVLLIVFAVLGFIYSIVTPVFEAPDEPWHFNFVRYVAEGRGLPSLRDNASGAYQEVGQPPLYYLIAGLVIAPIGDAQRDTRGLALHNPGFGYQAPGTVNDNKNLMAHGEREAFPWGGASLAIHLARLVSLAFGMLTVLATWGLAYEVYPDSTLIALSAAAVVAFTPQLVFISSVTSNDSSAAALSTATLWAIARIMHQGVTYRRAALAGVLVGLASLTKTSTILLGGFAIVAILLRLKTADHRLQMTTTSQWLSATVLASAALAVGGWWYIRNGLLYSDPLGLSVHLNTPWARPGLVPLSQVFSTMPLTFRSFWGAFGWGNVEMSPVIYVALGSVIAASWIGWLVGWLKSKSVISYLPTVITLMCLGWCSAVFVSFLRWNQQVEAPQGRLLFPMLGAFALLLVAGLAHLPQPRLVLGIALAGLFLLSLAAPFVYIRPAYARPELLPLDQFTVQRSKLKARNLSYGDEARLIGFALDRSSVAPGEWLNVTLCWTALKPVTRNYTLFVHLLGQEDRVVGARNTWPGLGRFPTTLWPVNRAFCDTTPVRVETDVPVPELYAVEVGLYDAQTNERLEAMDASTGQLILPPIVGRVRIAPKQPVRVSPQHVAQADFGSVMLVGFDVPGDARPGESVSLQLDWRAMAELQQDYTVFVHLLDASGKLVVQTDGEPYGGAYPTSAWVVGDVIPDKRTLALPANLAPGEYTLNVGLYLAPNGPRLPLKPSGDSFTLGTLRVR